MNLARVSNMQINNILIFFSFVVFMWRHPSLAILLMTYVKLLKFAGEWRLVCPMSINDGLSTHTLAMVVISTHNTEAMVFTLKVVDSTAVGLIGISHPSRGNARRNAIGIIKFTVWCSVQILRGWFTLTLGTVVRYWGAFTGIELNFFQSIIKCK